MPASAPKKNEAEVRSLAPKQKPKERGDRGCEYCELSSGAVTGYNANARTRSGCVLLA